MNCREVQANIIRYINKEEMDAETTALFIEHVRGCADCKNELEIYYTILKGFENLDEEKSVQSDDLQKSLEEDLTLRYNNAIRRQQNIETGATLALLLLGALVLYGMTAVLV